MGANASYIQKKGQSLAPTGPQKIFSDDNSLPQLDAAFQHIQAHHGRESDGYIYLGRKRGSKFQQQSYKLEQMTMEMLAEWLDDPQDVYFSQQTFYHGQRKLSKYVRQIRTLYVDLDVYNAGRSVADTVYDLMLNHFGHTMPHPNRIVKSGRGLQLVWDLVPVREFKRDLFAIMEDFLIGQCVKYGVDTGAHDLARVFRMAGSINSKSGARVEVLYQHEAVYDLQELIERYVPAKKPRTANKVKWGNTTKMQPDHPLYPHRKNIRTLFIAWAADIRKLSDLRGGRCNGHRHLMMFLTRYFVLLYTGGDDDAAMQSVGDLNDSFTEPKDITGVERGTRSAIQAYDDWAEKYPAPGGYRYTGQKLVDLLDIKPAEQKLMTALIGQDERKGRKRVRTTSKRRAAGVKPAAEYQQSRKDGQAERIARIQEALAANPGASGRKLAELAGVHESYIRKLRKIGALD